ncbi:MAG: DUF2007-related protein [Patescibacteria group bacterium]|jgi:hypothetical protein|nr:DUF2007-related protein [Patescibacteria group bacterium]
MNNKNAIKSIEIFNGITWQAQMIKNLLENSGIEAFLQDETIGSLTLPWAAPDGLGLVKVIVLSSDYENAKLIVDEYEKNLEANK